MSKGKRGAPRGNNRVGAAMADRERARCRVAHLGHERGNSRSTNSQNAKSARPLMRNGPSRRGHWLGPLFLKVRVGGRRSPARTIQAALSAAMLQITISHNLMFLCRRPTLCGRCRLTVVHRNLSDEPMNGAWGGGRGSPGVSKRWLNALTMAGSHGSAEVPNTSAALIKSASQAVLGSALDTERPTKIPVSASDTRRKHEPRRC